MIIKERIVILQNLEEMINSLQFDIDHYTNNYPELGDIVKAKQYILKQLEKIASAV